jgi:gas vesicle protein
MKKNRFISGLVVGTAVGVAGGLMLQKNKDRLKAKLYYLKIRADIERELKDLKKFSRDEYTKIVENILEEYHSKIGMSAQDFDLLKKELKSQWKEAKQRFEAGFKEEVDENDDEDES